MDLTIKHILPGYRGISNKGNFSISAKVNPVNAHTILAKNVALRDAEVNRYRNAVDTIQLINR